MATTLQKQQQGSPAKPGFGSIAADARAGHSGGGAVHPDLERARTAYRDAREVYDLLRCDAEDLNSRLWRWGAGLRSQVTALEREVARMQTSGVPDPDGSWQNALSQRDAYIHSTEEELAELQGSLQATHERLLRRDLQVATLQDMLVQLSEQVATFEGVVVRCEMLSSDLITKAGMVGASGA
eukprot:XP_001697745.1 predicted protein [Chlamydomonas reinhardtii]